MSHDVIIAGAGPVGLMLAGELALAGCSVLVLEREADPAAPLKGFPFGLRGLSLPTIDALDRRGLLAPLRAPAPRGGITAHWAERPRRLAGHFAGIAFFADRVDETAWPDRRPGTTEPLAVTVADLEAVLTERALALGVAIRRGCSVDAAEQTADGVTVRASGEAFRAGWLVGCDGGRSAVRKAAGIGFAGTAPEFTGYSVQATLADPAALPAGRHHGPGGVYTFAPSGTLAMTDFDGGAQHRQTAITPAQVEAVLRRVSGVAVRVTAVAQAATWTDRAYLAAAYRTGRVLVAGDAAHVHSPLGGQGLNLGIGDAVNLGWKLAATVRRGGDLLASYEAERRPVATAVLDWSRAQVALMRPDPGTRALRDVVAALAETRDGATFFAGRVRAATLRHDLGNAHPLVGASAPDLPLADGTRLNERLRDGNGLLLDLHGDTRLRALAAARVRYLAADPAGPTTLGALLVRPDGVVAWASEGEADLPAVGAAIECWFGAAM